MLAVDGNTTAEGFPNVIRKVGFVGVKVVVRYGCGFVVRNGSKIAPVVHVLFGQIVGLLEDCGKVVVVHVVKLLVQFICASVKALSLFE